MSPWRLEPDLPGNAEINQRRCGRIYRLTGTDARIGTFEIRTADVRSLRIEPSAEIFGGSPITTNTIAGSSANEVLPGVRGATISGGGVPSGDSDPDLF